MSAKLITQEVAGGLHITGVTECGDVSQFIGTEPELAEPITMTMKEASVSLAPAVRRSIQGGRQVIEGMVAFAQPIFIKGATLGAVVTSPPVGKMVPDKKPKNVPNQSISALAAQMPQPGGATKGAAYTIDDSAIRELAHILGDLNDPAHDKEHFKAAAHPFHDHLIDSIEDAKVDGKEIGLTVPVKVAFRDDATRDLFVNWFGEVQRKKKAVVGLDDLVKAAGAPVSNVEALADLLVTTGAVKSSLRL